MKLPEGSRIRILPGTMSYKKTMHLGGEIGTIHSYSRVTPHSVLIKLDTPVNGQSSVYLTESSFELLKEDNGGFDYVIACLENEKDKLEEELRKIDSAITTVKGMTY